MNIIRCFPIQVQGHVTGGTLFLILSFHYCHVREGALTKMVYGGKKQSEYNKYKRLENIALRCWLVSDKNCHSRSLVDKGGYTSVKHSRSVVDKV